HLGAAQFQRRIRGRLAQHEAAIPQGLGLQRRALQQAVRYTPGIFTGQVGASNRYDYIVMRGFADNSVDN
ncbi:hypothetical protein R0G64_32525, partial [Pseudomonas otitidis]